MQNDGARNQALEMPSDNDGCHSLIAELTELVERLCADNSYPKQRLHNLLREKFGRSSEKLSVGQLQLFAQELQGMLERETPGKPEQASASKPNKSATGGRNGGGGRSMLA